MYDFKSDFDRDGFVVVKKALSRGLLYPLERDIAEVMTAQLGWRHPDKAIQEHAECDPTTLRIRHIACDHSSAFGMITEALTRWWQLNWQHTGPVYDIAHGILLGLPADSRLTYDWHQEAPYMKGFEDIISFHYPLFKGNSIKSGAMSFYVGSHKRGPLKYEKRAKRQGYTDLVPLGVHEMFANYKIATPELELGDLVVFHQHVVHKSNYNHTDECRIAGVHRLTTDWAGDFRRKSPEEL